MLGTTTEQMQATAGVAELPGANASAAATLAGGPDRAQIIDMARKNPDATAVVVKEWLKNPT
jgi:flagellar M-ring protein FliF